MSRSSPVEGRCTVPFAAPDFTEADVDAVVRVLRGGWLTTGAECAALEEELAAHVGVPHVVTVSSCTAGLEISLASLDLEPGARVGVPTWTFVASALAAVHNRATPVLLDVDEDTLNLSPEALERALAEGLDAVVAVHFGGVPVAKEVHGLCAEAGVPVVEDAAHALGAEDHRGRLAGQGSVAACYSFYVTKNLTSAEGGAIATQDSELAAFARAYRLHGLSADAWARYRKKNAEQYDLVGPGLKANLPDVLAALARSQLTRFESLQARRRALVRRYRANLSRMEGLRPVPTFPDSGSADHLMVVVLPPRVDRETVRARMAGEGIATSVHFQPLHRFPWFEEHAAIGRGGVPVASSLAERVLSLPLYPALTNEEVDKTCEVLWSTVNT